MAAGTHGVSQFCLCDDCLTYAVMSNHCHLILRSRPELVALWSDHEIAVRWLRLCPRRKDESSAAAEPTTEEINMIASDSRRLKELRRRLSDIRWWVKMFSQRIAQQANQEDQCTGHFWEGCFKSQALLQKNNRAGHVCGDRQVLLRSGMT